MTSFLFSFDISSTKRMPVLYVNYTNTSVLICFGLICSPVNNCFLSLGFCLSLRVILNSSGAVGCFGTYTEACQDSKAKSSI